MSEGTLEPPADTCDEPPAAFVKSVDDVRDPSVPRSESAPAAASASAAAADESCSTASLLQYYDECAEFYDHTDEGAEDTYICVDRVTESILRALAHKPDAQVAVRRRRAEAALAQSNAAAALPALTIATPTPSAAAKALALLSLAQASELESSPSASPTPEKLRADDSRSGSGSDSAPSTPKSEDSPRSPSERGSLSMTPSTASSASSLSGRSSSASSSVSSSPSPAAFASSAAPMKILDLGVGTGLASRPLFANFSSPRLNVPRRSRTGEPRLHVPAGVVLPEVWGVDLSPNMLRVSSVLPFKHLIAGDLNTRLADPAVHQYSPLNTRNLAPHYFDLAVCVGTTEFVRDLRLLFEQVVGFLAPGGLFCGTFPSNQTTTYPAMTFVSVDDLTAIAESVGMHVMEVQQYRGWSVSADEHVEYIQLLASSAASPKRSDEQEIKA